MNWDRRPRDETPQMETRTFTDDDGRRWSGSVMSGRFSGGEDRAEVIFVCEDAPSEPKRFARLETPPAEAAAEWRSMDADRMRELFRDADVA
jgi:hypothetical protein